MSFEPLDEDQLRRACGGVKFQLTQFGYPSDPYMDSNTKRGDGSYHKLVRGESVGMTTAGLSALGLTRAMVRRDHPWVNIKLKGGGVVHRRIDDWGPERNARVDFYEPGGIDRSLGDFADVSLADGYTPHSVASHASARHTRHR